MNWREKSWVWASFAVLTSLLWQFSVAGIQFGGDWTGLFHSGDEWRLPAELKSTTYQHPGSRGYDGQFYRLAAHDPFNRKHYSEYMDNASYRRKRVLVPLLAWGLGFGQSRWIDFSYIAVLNGFVLLGAWLFGELARSWSRHPAWGMTFLLMPATLNSIDRMLPDLAMLAAMAGFVLFRGKRTALSWMFLAAGVLTRELGLLIVAAAVGQEIWKRGWRLAALWASAAGPALAWWTICSNMDASRANCSRVGWLAEAPFYGFFLRIGDPIIYHTTYSWLVQAVDAIVMLALPAAAVMAVWLWLKNRNGTLEWQALAGVSLAVLASNPRFLGDSASYPRAFSLLLCPLALLALRTNRCWYAIPCVVLSLRLALGLAGILARAAAGLLGA